MSLLLDSSIKRLNVSGRIFLVPSDILRASPFFEGMFEACKDSDEEIMIYRSPMLFECVLAYMYNPNYLYPLEATEEIDYFCLPPTTRQRPNLQGLPGRNGKDGLNGRDGKDYRPSSGDCSTRNLGTTRQDTCYSGARFVSSSCKVERPKTCTCSECDSD